MGACERSRVAVGRVAEGLVAAEARTAAVAADPKNRRTTMKWAAQVGAVPVVVIAKALALPLRRTTRTMVVVAPVA